MKKITDFTKLSKEEYSKLREAMVSALSKVAEDFGVTFKTGNVTHAEGFADMKVTISVASESGVTESRETLAFRQLAHLYDLKADDLGKTFKMGVNYMTIVGLNSRSERQPICLMDQDGKRYRAAADSVKRSLMLTSSIVAADKAKEKLNAAK